MNIYFLGFLHKSTANTKTLFRALLSPRNYKFKNLLLLNIKFGEGAYATSLYSFSSGYAKIFPFLTALARQHILDKYLRIIFIKQYIVYTSDMAKCKIKIMYGSDHISKTVIFLFQAALK
jgi:hypothetical protein